MLLSSSPIHRARVAMDPNLVDLVRPALGEVVRLGQLYSAASNAFIAEDLWTGDTLRQNTSTIQLPRTDLSFRQTSSIEDRSNLLELSASVTISYLGITGTGSVDYMQRSESRREDTNITAAIKISTEHVALDIQQMLSSTVFSPEQIKQIGATHVITGITYGGTYLGSITQRSLRDKDDSSGSGKLSISILQQLTSVVDASGEADLQLKKDRYATNSSIKVQVVSDIKQDDTAMVPMNIIPFLESLPSATKGLAASRGVPQTLTLTPLKLFTKFSTEVFFQELVESELKALLTFYDDFKSLFQDRKTQNDEFNADPGSKFFPTFVAQCRASERAFEEAYQAACAKLRKFLADYRLYAATETTQDFLIDVQGLYDTQRSLLQRDQAQSNLLLKLVALSKDHAYPLVTLQELAPLETLVTSNHDASAILILVPESTSRISLLDSFRTAHELLKLAGLNVSAPPADDSLQLEGSQCRTYYLDASMDRKLLTQYERPSGTLARAMAVARAQRTSVIVQYKYSPLVGTPEWQIFGDLTPDSSGSALPGVLTDSIKATRYLGGIREGLPHGNGQMTYLDGSVNNGLWSFGVRDGYGQIETPAYVRNYDSKVMEGTEGSYAGLFANGFPYDGTDYRLRIFARIYVEGRITAYATPVFASNGDSAEVVAKIARHFGWKEGQRFRLTTMFSVHQQSLAWPTGMPHDGSKVFTSTQSVVANGSRIEEYPYPADKPMAWPDEDLKVAIDTPGFGGQISSVQMPTRTEVGFSLPIQIRVEAL